MTKLGVNIYQYLYVFKIINTIFVNSIPSGKSTYTKTVNGEHLTLYFVYIFSETFYRKLKNNRADMMEFEKRHQVNEKLRPGKAKNASDLFGIQGNFKKLDID